MEETHRHWEDPMSGKEWIQFVSRVLTFLHDTDPPESSHLYETKRQQLPSTFLENLNGIFCYVFKGKFLPSGAEDGLTWRPSQGAKPSGENLMKRYFYCNENAVKVKRQVIWRKDDYRHSTKGQFALSAVQTPPNFRLDILSRLAEQHTKNAVPKQSTFALEPSSSRPFLSSFFSSWGSLGYSALQGPEPPEETQIDNSSMTSWLFGTDNYPQNPEPPTVDRVEPTYDEEPHTVASPPFVLPTSPISVMDPYGFLGTTDEDFTPSSDGISSPDVEHIYGNSSRLGLEDSTYDFNEEQSSAKRRRIGLLEGDFPPVATGATGLLYSSVDYLLSHLLSYDQIVNTVAQNIITQIIYNRRFFQVRGIDSYTIMDVVKVKTATEINWSDYPGQMHQALFDWLRQLKAPRVDDESPKSPGTPKEADLPSYFCLACGSKDHDPHDEQKHLNFWNNTDQNFRMIVQERAHNLFDWLSALIVFLLKYPQSRASFQQWLIQYLHCPFCSGQGFHHDSAQHERWKKLWQLSHAKQFSSPDASDEPTSYTRRAFDFIMTGVPFHIPDFLLNLPNVRSMMEVMVTSWNLVRVHAAPY
eukprot:TRINITY_DN4494_c0_g1_i3.p1 TRINITY_DN4494_c0_g1~~TRINITY_DN4494_c0_g1_i3.p1  ORF type:complete len:585 (-),score=118.22 TRINITY_DN4494_c0_g1_i3:64-1818(-)